MQQSYFNESFGIITLTDLFNYVVGIRTRLKSHNNHDKWNLLKEQVLHILLLLLKKSSFKIIVRMYWILGGQMAMG